MLSIWALTNETQIIHMRKVQLFKRLLTLTILVALQTEQFDEHCGTRGDLIIGLKFEAAEPRGKGTLHVLVKEAKNLTATKPTGLADVFCKRYTRFDNIDA